MSGEPVMTWTKTLPTQEGFYWVKAVGELSGRQYTTVVKVYDSVPPAYRHMRKPELRVFCDGENFNLTSDSFTEWGSEPIKEIP